MTYQSGENGVYVAAVGKLTDVLTFLKYHRISGNVVDVQDEKSASIVDATGNTSCIVEQNLKSLYIVHQARNV